LHDGFVKPHCAGRLAPRTESDKRGLNSLAATYPQSRRRRFAFEICIKGINLLSTHDLAQIAVQPSFRLSIAQKILAGS
jgi:hypothetical protein